MSEYLNLAGGMMCTLGCVAIGIVVFVLLTMAWGSIGNTIDAGQVEQYRQFIVRTGRSMSFYEWQQEQLQQTDEEQAYIGREVG